MTPIPKAIDIADFMLQKRGALLVDLRMLRLSVQFHHCQERLEVALRQGKPAEIRQAYERYVDRLLSEVSGLPSAWMSLDLLLGHYTHSEPDLPTIITFLYHCYPHHMTIPQPIILRLIDQLGGMTGPSTLH